MLDSLLSLFLVYQYALLFVVMYGASFGFPLPATALLMVGGVFYSQGYLSGGLLFATAIIACILGDMTGYALSYRYGKDIFRRIGLGKVVDSRIFHEAEPHIRDRGVWLVFFSRWIFTAMGPVVNILAGLTHMPRTRYIIIDIIGEILYVSIVITLGYSFSDACESILVIMESASTTILSLMGVVSLMYMIGRRLKREQKTITI